MAINVNEVYQTVLFILNKEQRGYLTPAEFNKIGTQVQLEVFEKYFDDLNQQLRVPETDNEYADRIKTVEDSIQIFERVQQLVPVGSGAFTAPNDIHRLGMIEYTPPNITPVQLQQMSQRVLTDTYRSPLTKPSYHFPVFVRRQNQFRVYPTTINDYINAHYIAKPLPVVWGWILGNRGQYLYDTQSSVDFELSSIEQTEVILKILAYAGIIIRDPQIVQNAQQMAAAEDINEKS
jgi:hypothetical protein